MKLSYTVTSDDKYINLKEVLKAYFQISDRLLLRLKKSNKIMLNSIATSINSPIHTNDSIEVYIDFEEDNSNIIPTKMTLNILYEDESILVVNKSAGIPVHPSMDHYTDSLSNGIRYYFDLIGLHKKIRPVNRLDKDTSGIVIFAKNEYIQECLIKQMKTNTFIKEYIAICVGIFDKKYGTIDAPIARKENSIIERCVNKIGDTAITHYEILEEISNSYSPCSVVKCILKTGRTHQIRVHMQYVGHPLIGDTLYGSTSCLIARQALHAYKISFTHPISHNTVTITSTIPNDMKKIAQFSFLVKE